MFFLKKRLIDQLLIFLFLFAPFVLQAAGLVPCGGSSEPPCTACDLLVLAQNVIHKALELAILVCIVLLIYGGFRWIFSFGNEENIAAGQRTIYDAIIGLVIILAAWIIVNTIFWLIAYIGGENYTGTWSHLKCYSQ